MRRECTAEAPYDATNPAHAGQWFHPLAKEVEGSQRDGYPAGDTVDRKCPACDLTFTEELPQ